MGAQVEAVGTGGAVPAETPSEPAPQRATAGNEPALLTAESQEKLGADAQDINLQAAIPQAPQESPVAPPLRADGDDLQPTQDNVNGVAVGVEHEVGDHNKLRFEDRSQAPVTDPAQGGADTVVVDFGDAEDGQRLRTEGPAARGTLTIDNLNNTVTAEAFPRDGGGNSYRNVYGYSRETGWQLRSGDFQNELIKPYLTEYDPRRPEVVSNHLIDIGDASISLESPSSDRRGDDFQVGVATHRVEGRKRISDYTSVYANSGAPGQEGTLQGFADPHDQGLYEEVVPRPTGFVNKEFLWAGNGGSFWSDINPSNLDGQDDGWYNFW